VNVSHDFLLRHDHRHSHRNNMNRGKTREARAKIPQKQLLDPD